MFYYFINFKIILVNIGKLKNLISFKIKQKKIKTNILVHFMQ